MSPARRDQLWMAAAAVLWLLGLAGWWRLPLTARSAGHIDLPILALWLSAGGLVAGTMWLVTHAPGEGWSPLVASLTLAATAPLSVVPLIMTGNVGPASRVALALAAVCVLPLAWYLGGRVARPKWRLLARAASLLCVVLGILAIDLITRTRFGSYLDFPYLHPLTPWGIRWLLVGAATLIPGLLASVGLMGAPGEGRERERAIVGAAVLAGAGALPVVTGAALWHWSWPAIIVPMAASLVMAAVLAWIVIGPLARSAGSLAVQRDLVAAASDRERLRLAAALHDGALSDVAVLVQRLDGAGDEANAALARTIADELRDIGNDLRLPVLDDLGVGAALEWLVARTSTPAAPVRLEVEETERPPFQVEAVVYRIAQEALLNATRHAAPPMSVRYASQGDRVQLEVLDSGSGIEPDAPQRALLEGRLGLLMMRQRAAAIGARLSLEAGAHGGTLVELTWPAPAT
jgi:signal transduction histidine kinase